MRPGAYKTAAAVLATLLTGAGVARASEKDDAAALSAAIAKSVPLLQSSAQTWIEKRSCVSCHHSALGSLAVATARERGFRVDEALVDAQLRRMHPAEPRDLLVGQGGENGQFGRSYMMAGMAGAGVPRSRVTDVMAHFVQGKQAKDGSWPSSSHRPPLEDSAVTVTALAIRALDAYVLLAAGYAGGLESVRLLLEHGASARSEASGLSPIVAATETGDEEKIALLLEAGAGLEEGAPDSTPLLAAAFQRDAGLLRSLAARGADSSLGAVDAAAMDGSLGVVRSLIDVGAPVDHPDEEGMTPLLWASTIDPGHSEIVEALLAAGADPNARAYDGRTPLAQAEGFGNWEIADRLRRAGARCE